LRVLIKEHYEQQFYELQEEYGEAKMELREKNELFAVDIK